jgi:hypothetical protein
MQRLFCFICIRGRVHVAVAMHGAPRAIEMHVQRVSRTVIVVEFPNLNKNPRGTGQRQLSSNFSVASTVENMIKLTIGTTPGALPRADSHSVACSYLATTRRGWGRVLSGILKLEREARDELRYSAVYTDPSQTAGGIFSYVFSGL